MERGFNIYGKHYPFVSYEDWLNQDFVLAWKLTDATTDELFADTVKLEQALVAVAVKHETPMSRDEVIDFVGRLKPSEIEDVGFEDAEPLSPLDEGGLSSNDASSSPSSDGSTEAGPASSKTVSSGTRGTGRGSQA